MRSRLDFSRGQIEWVLVAWSSVRMPLMDNTHVHKASHAVVVALSYGARVSRLEIWRGALATWRTEACAYSIPACFRRIHRPKFLHTGAVAEILLNKYCDPAEIKNDYERAAELLSDPNVKLVSPGAAVAFITRADQARLANIALFLDDCR